MSNYEIITSDGQAFLGMSFDSYAEALNNLSKVEKLLVEWGYTTTPIVNGSFSFEPPTPHPGARFRQLSIEPILTEVDYHNGE